MDKTIHKVHVALGERRYDIHIEDGLLDDCATRLAPFAQHGRLLVVSDENVWRIAGPALKRGLGAIQAVPVLIPPGEKSKSWSGLQSVVDRLLAERLERSDHVIAFGGGVVGDLAGFAAAIVKRGCGLIQIPTTLLAQVDSSVGGKTGIDVHSGKNLVGAFHQPSLVLIDPRLLDSLPSRELRAGYAEIVKFALIRDPGLFDWLEEKGLSVIAGEPLARMKAIAAAVAGKARIVEQDEQERTGSRALLNLGHTFGHALEAETGYSSRLIHGEAVALGCCLAFSFSAERGLCSASDVERVVHHLAAARLPTTLGEVELKGMGAKLVMHMEQDKKREGGRSAFVLSRGIGRAFLDRDVELRDVAAFLDEAP